MFIKLLVIYLTKFYFLKNVYNLGLEQKQSQCFPNRLLFSYSLLYIDLSQVAKYLSVCKQSTCKDYQTRSTFRKIFVGQHYGITINPWSNRLLPARYELFQLKFMSRFSRLALSDKTPIMCSCQPVIDAWLSNLVYLNQNFFAIDGV